MAKKKNNCLDFLFLCCVVILLIKGKFVQSAEPSPPENVKSDHWTMDITMNNYRPDEEDKYMCVDSRDVSGKAKYIVNMEALAKSEVVHHILLYGCKKLGWKQNLGKARECGSICTGGGNRIIWAWAKNAKPTVLPNDVGVMVGGDSGINQFVMQVHYKNPMTEAKQVDAPGIRLEFTSERKRFLAGILLFVSYDIKVIPGVPKVHSDISCIYEGSRILYPFAFRVHTHTLGSVVSAYHNNGSWSQIGKGNPQWPQAFYPINGTMEIKPQEKMAARCTYNGSKTDHVVFVGGTHKDEMCNFYMMYYTESSTNPDFSFQCGGNYYPDYAKELPKDNDVSLPPNPALEEKADHSHSHSHTSDEADNIRQKIRKVFEEVKDWPKFKPSDNIHLGQVSGLAVDSKNNLHFFHRGERRWGFASFSNDDVFTEQNKAIPTNTIVKVNEMGSVLDQWGANMFYMPHGLFIDKDDNVWITDVAMHQVMKFPAGSKTPSLVLGKKFQPGSDPKSFCKPADVAVLSTGQFFVADGYCNHRILKFDKDGKLLKQWGINDQHVLDDGFPPVTSLLVPHSLAVLETKKWVCVADREHGRIVCFDYEGNFVKQFHPQKFNGHLFAVTYDDNTDALFAVNGGKGPLAFLIDPDSGKLINTFHPSQQEFGQPHDIVLDHTGKHLYIADIGPNRIWHFNVDPSQINVILNHKSVKKPGVSVKMEKRPLSTGSKLDSTEDQGIKDADAQDMGASLVIGCLLIVPVIIIVVVSIIMRVRKTGKFSLFTVYRNNKNRRFNLGNFFGNHKGFDPLNTEDHEELDHLNSDSDVEEYSATTHKA